MIIKTSTSVLLTMPKSLTMWITTDCGKFFKIWEYQVISTKTQELGFPDLTLHLSTGLGLKKTLGRLSNFPYTQLPHP